MEVSGVHSPKYLVGSNSLACPVRMHRMRIEDYWRLRIKGQPANRG